LVGRLSANSGQMQSDGSAPNFVVPGDRCCSRNRTFARCFVVSVGLPLRWPSRCQTSVPRQHALSPSEASQAAAASMAPPDSPGEAGSVFHPQPILVSPTIPQASLRRLRRARPLKPKCQAATRI
jgi:hypothetical protein